MFLHCLETSRKVFTFLAASAQVAALSLTLVALDAAPAYADTLLLTHAYILDPRKQTTTYGHIFIENGRVAQIIPAPRGKKLKLPAADRTLSLKNRWVIPGLTDLHSHSWGNPSPTTTEEPDILWPQISAKLYLYSGVTTFVDLFFYEDYIFALRELQRQTHFDGAEILAAGAMITYPKGHGTEMGIPARVATTPEEADHEVQTLGLKRPDVIKIVYDHAWGKPSMDFLTLQTAIRSAHAINKKVIVHIGSWQDMREAIAAEADAVTHLDTKEVIPDDLVRLIVERKTAIIPTAAVLTELYDLKENPSRFHNPLLRAVAAPHLRQAYRNLQDYSYNARFWLKWQEEAREIIHASLAKLIHAGALLLTGSDSGNIGIFQGYSVHRELELFAKNGMSVWQALASGTTLAGDFLNRSFGVDPGSEANLIVLEASPLKDIRNTQRIVQVIHRGKIINRAKLIE